MKTGWKKAYVGPFLKKEAQQLAQEIGAGKVMQAKVQARSILKDHYDVYVR